MTYHRGKQSRTMAKLSLNKAAPYAGVAKTTILEALKTNDLDKKLSGEKNARGQWEIETSELDRVFGRTSPEQGARTDSLPPENDSQNRALTVEIKMLRERIDGLEAERERERTQLTDTIEDMRKRLDDSGEERRRLTAERESVLTAAEGVTMRRGKLARLVDVLKGQGAA